MRSGPLTLDYDERHGGMSDDIAPPCVTAVFCLHAAPKPSSIPLRTPAFELVDPCLPLLDTSIGDVVRNPRATIGTVILSDRYAAALAFTFATHRTQLRKGSNVPYLAHLIGVSSLVLEYGGTEDQAIAALLHDAAEDRGGHAMLAEIEARFGSAVSGIVHGCSDSLEASKPAWRERKQRYIEHLHSASPAVQLVSACDKLYNARAILSDLRVIGDSLWERFTGGREGTLWYYRELAGAFTIESAVIGELKRTVEQLRSLARDG
jgi:GTP pyrophosphokinase